MQQHVLFQRFNHLPQFSLSGCSLSRPARSLGHSCGWFESGPHSTRVLWHFLYGGIPSPTCVTLRCVNTRTRLVCHDVTTTFNSNIRQLGICFVYQLAIITPQNLGQFPLRLKHNISLYQSILHPDSHLFKLHSRAMFPELYLQSSPT